VKFGFVVAAVAAGAVIAVGACFAAALERKERLVAADNALAFRIGPDAVELGPGWSGRLDVEESSRGTWRCSGVDLDPAVTVTGRTEGRFDGPRFHLDPVVEVLRARAEVQTEWAAWGGRSAFPACLAHVFERSANGFRKVVRITSTRDVTAPRIGDRSRVVEIRFVELRGNTRRIIVSGMTSVGRAEFSVLAEAARADRASALSTVLRAERRFVRRAARAPELRR